jgi:diaminopimelate decarboxylase
MADSFQYINKRLYCENVDLIEFSKTVQTPYYIYSKKETLDNCQQVLNAGANLDFLPCYALKANYNPGLLKLVRNAGFGADVVSGGELYFALKAGFDPQKIVFSGVGKTIDEIEFAIKTGIHSLNIESAKELKLASAIAGKLRKKVHAAIRVNPDIEAQTHKYISTGLHTNKFGVSVDEAVKLYTEAQNDRWLAPQGIHVHIGSQITSVEPFLKTVKFLNQFKMRLEQSGIEISYIDLGGGIGINYYNDFQNQKNKPDFLTDILQAYLDGFKDSNLKVIVELGRSITGSSGLLISKVLYRKRTPQKNFIIVDAAMNNLIRPSLYNAYHEIVPLELNVGKYEICDIVGPVCESGDFLAKDRKFQSVNQNDLIAVTGAGAYGQALASNYNLRPKISEYLVDSNKVRNIYQGEKIENLAKQFKW